MYTRICSAIPTVCGFFCRLYLVGDLCLLSKHPWCWTFSIAIGQNCLWIWLSCHVHSVLVEDIAKTTLCELIMACVTGGGRGSVSRDWDTMVPHIGICTHYHKTWCKISGNYTTLYNTIHGSSTTAQKYTWHTNHTTNQVINHHPHTLHRTINTPILSAMTRSYDCICNRTECTKFRITE